MDYSRNFKTVRWWLKHSDKTENIVIVECTHCIEKYFLRDIKKCFYSRKHALERVYGEFDIMYDSTRGGYNDRDYKKPSLKQMKRFYNMLVVSWDYDVYCQDDLGFYVRDKSYFKDKKKTLLEKTCVKNNKRRFHK
jgi:hypothetical protein